MSDQDKDARPKAAKANWINIKHASEDEKNNREFVLEAVKQRGWNLQYASEDLKNDRHIVLEAVKQRGGNLQYASEDLKNDREIVLIALYSARYSGYIRWRNEKQFEILRKEKQFKLVKENSFEEFQKEALHFSSENGFAFAMRIILHEQNHLLAHTTIARAGNKYNRPLHRAAKEGHLEACKVLLDIGGRVKSNKGKTPLELAKQSRHDRDSKLDDDKRDEFDNVIYILLQRAGDITKTGIGGAGDALHSALKDKRFVVQIEWCTCSLPGLGGKIGAVHSILVVTVSDEGKAAKHDDAIERYFVENADSVVSDNNVKVSFWKDSCHREHKFKSKGIAEIGDIKEGIKMADLYREAKKAGDYDTVDNNCHHTAKLVFNFALHGNSR